MTGQAATQPKHKRTVVEMDWDGLAEMSHAIFIQQIEQLTGNEDFESLLFKIEAAGEKSECWMDRADSEGFDEMKKEWSEIMDGQEAEGQGSFVLRIVLDPGDDE